MVGKERKKMKRRSGEHMRDVRNTWRTKRTRNKEREQKERYVVALLRFGFAEVGENRA